MGRFGQVLTAMVTPFDDAGALDLDAAATLAKWLVAHGNDGLVLAGTTGESPTLTHDEQVALIQAVTAAVGEGTHVIAGAGSNDTVAAVELTKRATAAGASAILSVTPYYNRPSQAGLEAHFDAVAAATDLPVCVGFGIRTPEGAAGIARVADGAVVGSAIVERLGKGERPEAVLDFVRSLAVGAHS